MGIGACVTERVLRLCDENGCLCDWKHCTSLWWVSMLVTEDIVSLCDRNWCLCDRTRITSLWWELVLVWQKALYIFVMGVNVYLTEDMVSLCDGHCLCDRMRGHSETWCLCDRTHGNAWSSVMALWYFYCRNWCLWQNVLFFYGRTLKCSWNTTGSNNLRAWCLHDKRLTCVTWLETFIRTFVTVVILGWGGMVVQFQHETILMWRNTTFKLRNTYLTWHNKGVT